MHHLLNCLIEQLREGAIPWQYKPTAIAIEAIIGILFCAIGVYGVIFSLTSPTPGVSGLLGILFVVAGIFFLYNAIYRATDLDIRN